MLLMVLIVLLAIFLIGGGLAHASHGMIGWSPAGAVLVVVALLYFTGYLRLD